ncbi:hypothetical protein P2318_07775 [Myxococcaceae bacterium GXIMD 01537]
MRQMWLCAVVLLSATAASANEDWNADQDGWHRHDGLYLRIQGGLGYNRAESRSVNGFAIKGGSGALNLELGVAVVPNFIIFGKLYGSAVPSPDLEIGSVTVEGSDDRVSSNLGAVGAGLTYYFMPANFYLTGALTMTQLSITNDGEKVAETETGGGLHLGLGKEWWASENWGLGLGVEFVFSRIPSSGRDDWDFASGSLLFSATFN